MKINIQIWDIMESQGCAVYPLHSLALIVSQTTHITRNEQRHFRSFALCAFHTATPKRKKTKTQKKKRKKNAA